MTAEAHFRSAAGQNQLRLEGLRWCFELNRVWGRGLVGAKTHGPLGAEGGQGGWMRFPKSNIKDSPRR